MARLWAMTVDFETVAVGDTLPVLIKWETEETILRYIGLQGDGDDIDGDEIVGDDEPLCLPERTVASYVTELLGKGFPPERLEAVGSSVEVEHLLPVLANDTISLSGAVVDKRVSAGQRLVECSLAVDNDRGEPVARARAVISL